MLMVIFLTTLMLISVMAAAPYIRTVRQREKEEEMIWRGKQYVRGIKLYYRKMGRFPTSVDDLTKPKLGSIRFMRQAYKDPMNKEDGSWRMIYVSPAGQLIGSLKPQQTVQILGLPGAPAGTNAQQTTSFGASGFGGSGFGQSSTAQPFSQRGRRGATQSSSGAQDATGNAANTPSDAVSADTGITTSGASGLVNADAPVIGGNIIGVGSKINRRSVIVYDKAKNYRLFEFVWNPSKDAANAINQQIGAPKQNPQGTGQGQTGFGFGQQNNAPGNPTANPPTDTVPTPPPNQNPPQQ